MTTAVVVMIITAPFITAQSGHTTLQMTEPRGVRLAAAPQPPVHLPKRRGETRTMETIKNNDRAATATHNIWADLMRMRMCMLNAEIVVQCICQALCYIA